MKNYKLLLSVFMSFLALITNSDGQIVFTFGDDTGCIQNDLSEGTCGGDTLEIEFNYEGVLPSLLNISTTVNGSFYKWIIVEGANDIFEFTPPIGAGTYEFTLFEDLDANDMYDEYIDCTLGIMSFDVNGNPDVTIDEDYGPLCNNGSSIEMAGSPVPDGSNSSMGVWSGGTYVIDNNGENDNSSATFDPIGLDAGSYPIKYEFTDENGCSNSATADIIINAPPKITNSNDLDEICSGQMSSGLTITTDPEDATVEWQAIATNVDGLTTMMGSTKIIPAEIFTNDTNEEGIVTYTINATYEGCTTSEPFIYSIKVNPIPIVTNTVMTDEICNEGEFSGFMINTNGVEGTNINWQIFQYNNISMVSNDAGSGNEIPSQIFNLINDDQLGSVTYRITLSNDLNICIPNNYVFDFIVTVNQLPSFNLGSPICSSDLSTYNLPFSSDVTDDDITIPGINGVSISNGAIINIPSENNEFTVTATNPDTECEMDFTIPSFECTCTGTIDPPSISLSENPVCQGADNPTFTIDDIEGFMINWYGSQDASGDPIATGGSFTPTNTALDTYTYYAEYEEDMSGCTSSLSSVSFTIKPTPVVSPIPDMEICSGESINISLSAMPMTNTFSWNQSAMEVNGGGDGSGSAIMADLSGDGQITYSIIATLDDCDSGSEEVTIQVNGLPDVSISNDSDSEVCEGKIIKLIGESMNISTWDWSGPNGNSSNDNEIVVNNASLYDGGMYSVNVTDQKGCTANTSINVIVAEEIKIDDTVTDLLCFEDGKGSININLSGGFIPPMYNIGWSNNVENETTISELQAGAYSVTATSGGGDQNCVTIDNFEVSQPQELSINTLEVFGESCNGDNDGKIIIEANGGTVGVSGYSYQVGTDSEMGTEVTFSNLTPNSYIVKIEDSNGCTLDSGEETVSSGTEITPNIVYDGDLSFCEDKPGISITDMSSYTEDTKLSNSWTVNGGPAFSSGSISFGEGSAFSDPGAYSISLMLSAMSNPDGEFINENCSQSVSINDVEIFDTPEIGNISFTDQDGTDGDCRGDSYQMDSEIVWFDNNSLNSSIIEYDWNAVSSQTSNMSSPLFMTPNSGDLDVSLVVTSNDNCKSSEENTIQIINENPEAKISGTAISGAFLTGFNWTLSSELSEPVEPGSNILSTTWGITPTEFDIISGGLTSESVEIKPTVSQDYIFNLSVTNSENCNDTDTETRESSLCNATLTTVPDIKSEVFEVCQNESFTVEFTVEATPGGSQLAELEIYIRLDENTIQPIYQNTEINGSLFSVSEDISINQVGSFDIIGVITENAGDLACNGNELRFGSIRVLDLVNLENLDISLSDSNIICRDSIESNKIFISGIRDIDDTSLELEYKIEYLGTTEPIEFNRVDLIEDTIFLDLDFKELDKVVEISFLKILNNGECNEEIDQVISYTVIDCGQTGIENGIKSFFAPTIQNQTSVNICSNNSAIVDDVNVEFFDPNEAENLTINNILLDEKLESVEEITSLIDLSMFSNIVIEENTLDISIFDNSDLDLEFQKEYFIYSSISNSTSVVVSEGFATATFFRAPDIGALDLQENNICQNGLLEVSMSPQEGSDYSVLFQIGDNIVIPNEQIRSDSTGFLYLVDNIFTSGSTHSIAGVATFEYQNVICNSESDPLNFTMSSESAPPQENIRWWPNNILTSEADTSTTCFQWGVIDKSSGDDISSSQLLGKDINRPYLFTDDSQFIEFKNSPANPNTEFARIYYLDTWLSEVQSCGVKPANCFTRVFFTEDQFDFRAEESPLSDVLISPNPSNGRFVIRMPFEYEDIDLEIFNVTGQRIASKISKLDEQNVEVSLDPSIYGLHFISIMKKGENAIVNKVIITK